MVEGALLTLHISHSVLVVEISSTGARLQGSALPPDGGELWLKVGRLDILATVEWLGGGLCGVSFDEPLTPEQLNYLHQECGSSTVRILAMQDWNSGLAR